MAWGRGGGEGGGRRKDNGEEERKLSPRTIADNSLTLAC